MNVKFNIVFLGYLLPCSIVSSLFIVLFDVLVYYKHIHVNFMVLILTCGNILHRYIENCTNVLFVNVLFIRTRSML